MSEPVGVDPVTLQLSDNSDQGNVDHVERVLGVLDERASQVARGGLDIVYDDLSLLTLGE